jgi:glutathione peroxidase-family protein
MPSAYDFIFTRLSGEKLPLKNFAGKAILVVNTASACGYTPQYEDLERLWRANKDKGFVVLGVPCNQFGGQEPGSEAEIGAFCRKLWRDVPADCEDRRQRQGRAPLLSMGEQGGGGLRPTEMEFP